MDCPNCGCNKLIWQSDFDFEDYGYEGQGIVSNYECLECHTRMILEIPIGENDQE